MISLYRFHSIRPPYETKQEETFDWFVEAHAASEKTKGGGDDSFRSALKERLWKVGAKSDCIAKRGHILPDFLHKDWERMEIYRLLESPSGLGLSERMERFRAFVDGLFDSYYPEEAEAPDDLIHVSCTGYLSPSGAQKLVSKKQWGRVTAVTHAYHMGCYGAFPAIRMAAGFLACGKRTADIVHTEVCSLHSNPALHDSGQLVSQSLFADGFIKYTASLNPPLSHFRVLSVHEEIIPGSIESMAWDLSSWGNSISLSKEIPVLISRAIEAYLKTLCERAGLPAARFSSALFAIHPGGPKIVRQIQERLGLAEAQISHSLAVLKECGNMSSATLPHVWEALLLDPAVPANTLIVSLAFGPGLTIAGSIMVKSCG